MPVADNFSGQQDMAESELENTKQITSHYWTTVEGVACLGNLPTDVSQAV